MFCGSWYQDTRFPCIGLAVEDYCISTSTSDLLLGTGQASTDVGPQAALDTGCSSVDRALL